MIEVLRGFMSAAILMAAIAAISIGTTLDKANDAGCLKLYAAGFVALLYREVVRWLNKENSK